MTVTDTVGTRTRDWWTVDDLVELPDDGARYELVDGALLVSPAPAPRHALRCPAICFHSSDCANLRIASASSGGSRSLRCASQ